MVIRSKFSFQRKSKTTTYYITALSHEKNTSYEKTQSFVLDHLYQLTSLSNMIFEPYFENRDENGMEMHKDGYGTSTLAPQEFYNTGWEKTLVKAQFEQEK